MVRAPLSNAIARGGSLLASRRRSSDNPYPPWILICREPGGFAMSLEAAAATASAGAPVAPPTVYVLEEAKDAPFGDEDDGVVFAEVPLGGDAGDLSGAGVGGGGGGGDGDGLGDEAGEDEAEQVAAIERALQAIKSGSPGAGAGANGDTRRQGSAQSAARPSTGAATAAPAAAGGAADASSQAVRSNSSTGMPVASVVSKPTVVDDFIRNFLMKHGMKKSLDCFQAEWFQLVQEGRVPADDARAVPDIYTKNQQLEAELQQLRAQVQRAEKVAEDAKGMWDKFRRERDTHKMHHRRVVQEKDKLLSDLRRVKAHVDNLEPTVRQLRKRLDEVGKEKVLLTMERDKLASRLEALEVQHPGTTTSALDSTGASSGSAGSSRSAGSAARTHAAAAQRSYASMSEEEKKRNLTSAMGGASHSGGKGGFGASSARKDAPFPPAERENPYLEAAFDPLELERFTLNKTFKAHSHAISALAMHPTKPVVATASDDRSWKIWSLPKGDLVISGEGHKDWISGCDFHPQGTILATASGDATLKLWDLKNAVCAATLTDHTHAVWDVAFHDLGDFVASCSLDHTARLWDLRSGRCRQTYRGHVDSVNALCWQPFSNNLCTGSGDKTVALYDMRSGLCVQSFYGHSNAVNHVAFNLRGDSIVSADADGALKVWDVRMVTERCTITTAARMPFNQARFDRSGQRIVAASDSGVLKVFGLDGKPLADLVGHEEAVQAVVLDPQGKFAVSSGADATLRLWRL
jgi:hypothetical protein